MNISHIEHLGIAVKSLEEAIPYYENILGLECYSIEEVADQKVRTAFFKLGQTRRGNSSHGVCYRRRCRQCFGRSRSQRGTPYR